MGILMRPMFKSCAKAVTEDLDALAAAIESEPRAPVR
jgi:hypothetical protein